MTIGVFDSGSGGLTILKALRAALPGEDFVYLGDHRNAPYGHRSNDDIVDLTTRAVDHLMGRGCRLVILACNTAAAVALRTIQQDWLPRHYPHNRVLGVLVPMVEAITGVPWHSEEPSGESLQDTRSITLFATRKTVESGAFAEELRKRAPGLKLTSKACPGLVDAIEGGAGDGPLAGLINGYVSEAGESADAVVLGCTHFPLVENHFRSALGDTPRIYSQSEVVAEALSDYLARRPEYGGDGSGKLTLLSSAAGVPDHLAGLGDLMTAAGGGFLQVDY